MKKLLLIVAVSLAGCATDQPAAPKELDQLRAALREYDAYVELVNNEYKFGRFNRILADKLLLERMLQLEAKYRVPHAIDGSVYRSELIQRFTQRPEEFEPARSASGAQ